MSNFWIDQEIFQLLIHCFQMLIFGVIAVIAISVGKLVTSVFLLADTLINMTKTKLSTIYRFIVLVLFLVSWVSLGTAAKDEQFPCAGRNGIKGKKIDYVSLTQSQVAPHGEAAVSCNTDIFKMKQIQPLYPLSLKASQMEA